MLNVSTKYADCVLVMALAVVIVFPVLRFNLPAGTFILVLGFLMGNRYCKTRERFFELRHATLREITLEGHTAGSLHYGSAIAHRAAADIIDNDDYKETIAAAAIRHPNGLIFSAKRPYRHHHCIRAMAELKMAGLANTHDQGFITSKGRYVDRREGLLIATTANQLVRKTAPEHILFSEDVWF